MDTDVIIIGAGVSGLSCAGHLMKNGRRVLILEADHRIGGRIKSDVKDGFILDHGFQVLQTAYPEARRQLDFDQLQLRPFWPGVAVRTASSLFYISDPVRRPREILPTLTAPIGSLADRFRLLRLFAENRVSGVSGIFASPDLPTSTFLKSYGFSDRMIQRFFRPFFAGACLDPEIKASSRVFRYLFSIFASGDAALPAKGMGEIPLQLAAGLPKETIRLGARVAAVETGKAILGDGQVVRGRTLVVATEGPETSRLLRQPVHRTSRPEHCLYFSAETPPIDRPFLILNGQGRGRINNVAVPTLTAPSYSASGRHLIAVVVLGDRLPANHCLETSVIQELSGWFGHAVHNWTHVRTYHLDHALPDQSPPVSAPEKTGIRVRDGIYACGEYSTLPGLQWALLSGRMTAQRILAETRA